MEEKKKIFLNGKEELKKKTNGRTGHYIAFKNKPGIFKNVRYIFKKKIGLWGSGNHAIVEKPKSCPWDNLCCYMNFYTHFGFGHGTAEHN